MNETRWQQNFEDVRDYLKEHNCGLLEIPQDVRGRSNSLLYRWVREMRNAYMGSSSKFTLTEEKRALLDSIGFGTAILQIEDIWRQHFYELVEFLKNHELIELQKIKYIEGNFYLKGWLDNQRKEYRQGIMKQQRLQMFIDNGMLTILESPFEKGYRYAKAYYEENGNLSVPHNYICPDGFKLGAWITGIRDRVKHGKSNREYIPLLDEIGMIWDIPQYNWLQNYQICKEYYIKNGDLELPETLLGVNGQVLKNWLKKCRKQYDKHELTDEQENLLKDIHAFDIIPKPKESVKKKEIKKDNPLSDPFKKWQINCLEVKQFYDLNGHTTIPEAMKSSTGIVLRNWLQTQRKCLRKGLLSEQQIAFLNENGIYEIIAEPQ